MKRPTAFPLSFLAMGIGVVVAGACGDDTASGAGQERSITVFAAASLTDVFDEVGAAFEHANPGTSVELDYDGSSSLRDQILAGAPADVFASASPSTMDAVAQGGGLAGDAVVFATNELAIAVPPDSPAGVDGLEDLGDEALLVGLCDEAVPCGQLGRQALANAGVTPAPDTNEPNVRSLLEKVASGELDAGIVYVTDVEATGDEVEGVEIRAEVNVVAEYPIATLEGTSAAEDAEVAAAFVSFVRSDEGQQILRAHGFGSPS